MNDDRDRVLVDRLPGMSIVTFNRPLYGNALSPAMVADLTDVFQTLSRDRSVRAVLIRGEGQHLCTGGDVQDFAQLVELSVANRRAVFAADMTAANAMILAFAAIEMPVVVASRGAVAGGGLSFLLAADLVLADETTTLHFSQLRFGLPPDAGITALLSDVVGDRQARNLVLNAASVDVSRALQLGLITRVVDSTDLTTESIALTERLARGPADVMRVTKRLLRHAHTDRLAARLSAERDAVIDAVGLSEFEDGVRAFLARRPPRSLSSSQSGDRWISSSSTRTA